MKWILVCGLLVGCAGGGYVSSHDVVESQRAQDAVSMQQQWQTWTLQQQQQTQQQNDAWSHDHGHMR